MQSLEGISTATHCCQINLGDCLPCSLLRRNTGAGSIGLTAALNLGSHDSPCAECAAAMQIL